MTYTNDLTGLVIDPYNDTDRFEPAQAVLKELDIRFSLYYTRQQFAETFMHLAAGDFDVAALLTRTVGLDGVADVFARLHTSPHDAKILLDPSRRASTQPQQEDGRLGRRHTSMITSPGIQLSLLAEQRAATTSHRCWERAYNEADSAT